MTIFKVFVKKYLKFFLKKGYINPLILYVIFFILYLTNTNIIPQKKSCKRDIRIIIGFSYFEVILLLLAKSIIIKVKLAKI